MRSILHSLVLAPVVMAAAALAPSAAMAEAIINVPFNFTVSGKNCPAGQYIIQRDPIHNFVTLRGKNAPVGFNWILGPGDGVAKDTNIRLSFDQQDQHYSLQTVQFGSDRTRRLDKGPRSEHKTVMVVQGGQ